MTTGRCCRCLYWTRLTPELVCESCRRSRAVSHLLPRAHWREAFLVRYTSLLEDEHHEQEQMRLYLQRITASAIRITAPASDTLPRSRPSHEEIERRRDTVLAKYNSRLPLYRPR